MSSSPHRGREDWDDSLRGKHDVVMGGALAPRRATQVALGGRIRRGDHVLGDDHFVEVTRVRRAQGRKPARGENLHLLGGAEFIKVNSLDAIRIRARRT